MKFGQLVIGPAGSGKSSYCKAIYSHCATLRRSVHIINLDPAAEEFSYPVSFDIRDLISLDDVSESLKLGPNGGLIFCMEYLIENISWLRKHLGSYEDDYLLFDCPGQIELYSHVTVMPKLINYLKNWGYRLCCVYLLDINFISDNNKFISGILSSLSAMIQLELSHINLLTKMDILIDNDKNTNNENDDSKYNDSKYNDSKYNDSKFNNYNKYIKYFDPNIENLKLSNKNGKYYKLTLAISNLLSSYNMVHFYPFSIKDINLINNILVHIDIMLQYGEDIEIQDPDKWIKNKNNIQNSIVTNQNKTINQTLHSRQQLNNKTNTNKE